MATLNDTDTENGNGNAKVTIKDLDMRLRAVEVTLAEQHGFTRTLTIMLQASTAVNIAFITGLFTYLLTRGTP